MVRITRSWCPARTIPRSCRSGDSTSVGRRPVGHGQPFSDQEDGVREPLLLTRLWDPEWGHITIKMAGHPPFGAQIILNGHEYVACRAAKTGLTFSKEGNCFTQITDTARLAKIADTLADKR